MKKTFKGVSWAPPPDVSYIMVYAHPEECYKQLSNINWLDLQFQCLFDLVYFHIRFQVWARLKISAAEYSHA